MQSVGDQLRSFALGLPEAYEELPWGHSAFKVKKKSFCFLSCDDESLGVSFKLPLSAATALEEPWASPTGYGLGKSGWVSESFSTAEDVPVELLKGWIEESYRAFATRTLLKQLEAEGVREQAPTARAEPDPAVVVVSGDPLRSQRAVDALAPAGVGAVAMSLDAEQLGEMAQNAKQEHKLRRQLEVEVCFREPPGNDRVVRTVVDKRSR